MGVGELVKGAREGERERGREGERERAVSEDCLLNRYNVSTEYHIVFLLESVYL